MIDYETALTVEYAQKTLKPKVFLIEKSLGLIAAECFESHTFLPRFAMAAMDGFAVRSADLETASTKNPITLPIIASIAAGDDPKPVSTLGVMEIMTGANVLENYNAVVKIEDVAVEGKKAIFTKSTEPQNNIRKIGSDFVSGDKVIEKGEAITAFHIMAMAALGKKQIKAYPRPQVEIFSTGKEIIDDIGSSLTLSQSYNSSAFFLVAALKEIDNIVSYGGGVQDNQKLFEKKITASEADIIISTGAVSAGRYDFVENALRNLNAEIMFHRVKVRPAHPILYAKLGNGRHFFGLPGNPVSAIVGLRFFVMPLICHLQNAPLETPLKLKTDSPLHSTEMRVFQKAKFFATPNGERKFELLLGQESFKIQPLLKSNCWASWQGDIKNQTAEIYPLKPYGFN